MSSTLSPRQAAFCAALASGLSVGAAASKVGIASRTAWYWLRRPAVRLALADLNAGLLAEAGTLAAAGMREAVEVLRATLRETNPWGTRLAAARVLLLAGMRLVELQDLETRLNRLEQLLEGGKHDAEKTP